MLTAAQLRAFDEQGYLVIENVLQRQLLHRLTREYSLLVDEVAKACGQITDGWSSLSFEQRLTRLLATFPEAYESLDISLPMRPDLDRFAGIHTGPAVFELLTDPAILDIVESVIGPEIESSPVQHVRIKPPERKLDAAGKGNSNMAQTGWHQDAAVVHEDADTTPILTVWVAITDATPEMGCMRAVPGSHRREGPGKHCPGKAGLGEIYIPPALLETEQTVDLAVGAGGVVLLHKKTWHGAGPNRSERVRWSFDLRYHPPGYPSGRDCFPGFPARSRMAPDRVLSDPAEWAQLWHAARQDIASGRRKAVFNARWEALRSDPLCA